MRPRFLALLVDYSGSVVAHLSVRDTPENRQVIWFEPAQASFAATERRTHGGWPVYRCPPPGCVGIHTSQETTA